MAIPTPNEIKLPLLKLYSDNKEYYIKDTIVKLVDHFSLTEEEKTEWLPSGRESVFENRVRWANWHLTKEGFVIRIRRGHFKIAKMGIKLLTQNSIEISEELITKTTINNANGQTIETSVVGQTPEELITKSFEIIEVELKEELITTIMNCSSKFFEMLVVDLLLKIGYGRISGIGRIVGKSGDGGIDGIIYQDRLGLDKIYIQAKRWSSKIGRPDIQQFIGTLEGKQAKKGVFITTSKFTKEAIIAANNSNKIAIIDGNNLAQLMIDFEVGISTVEIYKKKKIDYDYFPEE